MKRTWRVPWRGHLIEVTREWTWRHQREAVSIDGRLLDEEKAPGRKAFRELGGRVKTGGATYAIRVRLGVDDTQRGPKPLLCHVFEDNKLIGGDTRERIFSTTFPSFLGNLFEWVVLVATAFAFFFMPHDYEFEDGAHEIAYLVALPLCAAAWYFWGQRLVWWRFGRPVRMLGSLAAGGLTALVGMYVVLGIAVHTGQEAPIEGTVQRKYMREARYYIMLKPAGSEIPVELEITAEGYAAHNPGDRFREMRYRSVFGIHYR